MIVPLGIEITFFGCGLCLLQALERTLEPGKRRAPGILFYLFNSVIMLGIALIARGVPQRHPASLFLFFTSLFMIGPLNLFYYHALLYPDTPLPYRTKLHLAPALACLAAEIAFQFLPAEVRRGIVGAFLDNPAAHPLCILLAASSLHITAYAVIIMKMVLSDIDIGTSRREFRFILFVALGIVLVIAMLFGGFIAGNTAVFIGGSILNVMIHISLYIGIRAYPQFFSALKREIRKKRYEKSMLSGLDISGIAKRLAGLMREEKLYRDSDISLSSVAARMALSPHQLSQLLNERMNTGFWDFINRYRVDEAREILSRNPDASVISVCYSVGFNTKSSFNAAFKKMTGATPSEFKNRRG